MNLETELFGRNFMDLHLLLEEVEREARLDFELPEMYRQMHEKYFAFQDNENSKRICEKVFDKMI